MSAKTAGPFPVPSFEGFQGCIIPLSITNVSSPEIAWGGNPPPPSPPGELFSDSWGMGTQPRPQLSSPIERVPHNHRRFAGQYRKSWGLDMELRLIRLVRGTRLRSATKNQCGLERRPLGITSLGLVWFTMDSHSPAASGS